MFPMVCINVVTEKSVRIFGLRNKYSKNPPLLLLYLLAVVCFFKSCLLTIVIISTIPLSFITVNSSERLYPFFDKVNKRKRSFCDSFEIIKKSVITCNCL